MFLVYEEAYAGPRLAAVKGYSALGETFLSEKKNNISSLSYALCILILFVYM
jgi:hypothetical protein